jgi:fermentation-respiration switch protein FrsA (DUF1100 family)
LLGVLLAYRAAEAYTHPKRVRPDIVPSDLELTYEDVRLTTDDGVSLVGWFLPGTNGAAVLLIHGIGGNRSDLIGIARAHNRRGFSVLLLDLRAHGDSGGSASTMGVREVYDLRAAARYLAARPEVSNGQIGAFGVSLGGGVVITAAAQVPEIRAVAVDGAFSSVEWLIDNQFATFVRLPSWLGPMVVKLGSWQAGISVEEAAPIRHVKDISPRPLLLIHGGADQTIFPENSRLLAQAAGEPTELWILPDVKHVDGYYAMNDEYLGRIIGFFERSLLS